MIYNLKTHVDQAKMYLTAYFGRDAACSMVDNLKAQGNEALRINVIISPSSTSISLSAIKDYFTYTNGLEPKP